MGWIVWLMESALCAAASYAAAAAVYRDRGVLDRVVAAFAIGTGLVLFALHATGFAGVLSPLPLGVFSTALFAAVTALSLRSLGGAGALRDLVLRDLGAFPRLARDTLGQREIAVLTAVPAVLATGTVMLMCWYYRSWTWDPVWYHVPKTSYAIQERSLAWLDTANIWTQGNPHNIELLAVWNCIWQRDSRLDDSSQVPFLLMGWAVIAAWARRVGATRPLAFAAGAVWVAMPPVYLQAHSTHVDVAWNAIFTAAIYFTLGRPERRDRWMGFLCWGLFLGSKYTGLFHLALWGPWLLGRAIVEVRDTPAGQRLRASLDVAASGLFALGLGCFKYIQNFRHTGNPMFPFDVKVRALGLHFPGPSDPGREYGSGPDQSPTFFGAPNALQELLTSWYNDRPFYCPDVRSGGFGPVFRWLLLFAIVALAVDLLRGRNWRRGLLPLALFVEALMVPVPYMTRFILSAGCASLVIFCIVHRDLKLPAGRFVLSAALVALTWHGYQEGYRGFIVHPRYFEQARRATPAERASMQIDTFLWPSQWMLAKERELGPGDVLAYDEGVHFLGDLWSHDYDHRVVFVSSAGDPEAYVRRLRAMRAKWVGVTVGTPAEAALRAAGATWLFHTPDSPMAMFRMPAAP